MYTIFAGRGVQPEQISDVIMQQQIFRRTWYPPDTLNVHIANGQLKLTANTSQGVMDGATHKQRAPSLIQLYLPEMSSPPNEPICRETSSAPVFRLRN